MSRTVEVSHQSITEDEVEQLRDVAESQHDQSASDRATGSYFVNVNTRRPHLRHPSFGAPHNGSMQASESLPSTTGSSFSLGSNRTSGSMNRHRITSTSPHSSFGVGHSYEVSSPDRDFYTFNAGTASGLPSPSIHSPSGSSTPAAGLYDASANTSLAQVALRYRKPFAQRVLKEGENVEKPWLEDRQRRSSQRKSYWTFIVGLSIGVIGGALIIYFAYASVPRGKYCLVLDEQFEGDTINKDIWFHELETGGFGNGQFDWTTDSTNNSYVQDGKLYIVPTLTADALGDAAITNGYTLNLTSAGSVQLQTSRMPTAL